MAQSPMPTSTARSCGLWALVPALALALAAGQFVLPSSASAGTAAADVPDFTAVDQYVEAEMRATRLPGAALAIVQGDRIVHRRGFGVADDDGRPVTPRTPFTIGSITKSFTALAVMQLV